MDIDSLVESGASFFNDHTLWAVLIALVVGALIYWKPKDMFKLAGACLAVGAIIYVLSFLVDLTSQGIDEAQKFATTPDVKVD
jgi:cytochrome c biogenesis factor